MKVAIQWWLPRVAVLPALGALALAAGPVNEEHGLPQHAVEIARPFGFPITNSMVVTWIVAAGLIVFARIATRHMKQVPDGAQNFLELPPGRKTAKSLEWWTLRQSSDLLAYSTCERPF